MFPITPRRVKAECGEGRYAPRITREPDTLSASFDLHQAALDAALAAHRRRGSWHHFVDDPDAASHPVGAARAGRHAFDARRGRPFALAGGRDDHGGGAGEGTGAYGLALDISYPAATPALWLERAERAGRAWGQAAIATRTGVALEAVARLNGRSFELAHAVMHTTGQPWRMAYQSAGPHAQDRALMAIALTYEALRRVPTGVAAGGPARRGRTWRLAAGGTTLVLGAALWPCWGAYPGLFASLVAGNPVLVKPHPRAILPLALTVDCLRHVLAEGGFDPDVVQLCVDTDAAPVARTLATAPAVRVIDHAGSSACAHWLRAHAPDARLFAETRGLNPAVLDGTDDFQALCRDIAYGLTLHGGQTRTAPQLLFVPANGIADGSGRRSFDDVANGLAVAIDALVAAPEEAVAILGAIADPGLAARVAHCRQLGRVVRAAHPVTLHGYPRARTLSPLVVATEAGREEKLDALPIGPAALLVATHDTAESIERATHAAATSDALAAIVHSRDDNVLETAADAFVGHGIAVTCNPARVPADEAGRHERAAAWPAPGFATSRFKVVGDSRPLRRRHKR